MNIKEKHIQTMLFNNRKKTGENILNIIKDNGYTKSSFSKLIGISRPTLDKLINGEIDNKTTFTTHIEKIIEKQNITETELLEYKVRYMDSNNEVLMFSDNSPKEYQRSQDASEMFNLLEDIINLCEMYYE